MHALEQVVQDRKHNLGHTLQVELPYYVHHITNAVLRAASAVPWMSTSKLQQLMVDSVLSRDDVRGT